MFVSKSTKPQVVLYTSKNLIRTPRPSTQHPGISPKPNVINPRSKRQFEKKISKRNTSTPEPNSTHHPSSQSFYEFEIWSKLIAKPDWKSYIQRKRWPALSKCSERKVQRGSMGIPPLQKPIFCGHLSETGNP